MITINSLPGPNQSASHPLNSSIPSTQEFQDFIEVNFIPDFLAFVSILASLYVVSLFFHSLF